MPLVGTTRKAHRNMLDICCALVHVGKPMTISELAAYMKRPRFTCVVYIDLLKQKPFKGIDYEYTVKEQYVRTYNGITAKAYTATSKLI